MTTNPHSTVTRFFWKKKFGKFFNLFCQKFCVYDYEFCGIIFIIVLCAVHRIFCLCGHKCLTMWELHSRRHRSMNAAIIELQSMTVNLTWPQVDSG